MMLWGLRQKLIVMISLGVCIIVHHVLIHKVYITVKCFYVSMIWHNVKVNKLSHVWQFIDLDLHTTDLCTTFSSNNTITLVNCDSFYFVTLYSNVQTGILHHFYIVTHCHILYDLILLPTLFMSGFVVYIATCQSVFHVLYQCTTITVCMWLLTHAEIFVMVWICR